MNVQSYLPRNPLLQKHIDFYYFFQNQDPAFDTIYLSFPNLYTPLNIHRNANCTIGPYSTSVYGDPANDYLLLVQGMREFPLRVNLHGMIDKITIAFRPLGINHFLDRSFAATAPKDSQTFHEWDRHLSYPAFLNDFYRTESKEERIILLEDFLLSIYRPQTIFGQLERSVRLLQNFESRHHMDDVAADAGLHLRSFNREFRKHIGISPVGFRKIARFRHSLTNRLFNGQCRRLTDAVYQSDFYDQSSFINIYKKMTGSNPGKFFREIEPVGDDKILFQFVKK